MEPFSTAAIAAALTALLNSAAGEAGKSTWAALKGLVAGRSGRDPAPAAAVAELERAPADEAAAERLAVALRDAARTDPAVATWLERLRDVPAQSGPVNLIGGQAQVRGVIQGHTFHGDIHLG